MPAKITAKENILGKIFGDDYVFEIPMYQRPYVWEEGTVQQLLDDVRDAMSRGGDEPYFLGSTVLIKGEGDTKSEVVDGQQRLTTLTMLFCVLRELSDNATVRSDLDKRVRAASDTIGGVEGKVRLRIRPQDQEFFEKYVQKNNSSEAYLSLNTKAKNLSDSQIHIAQNIKKLHEELEKLDEEARLKLAQYLDQNCYLVVVSASDVDSAYRIFSVMNNRGIPLSPTDILKAAVIGNIQDGSSDEYGKRWEDIEEELGRDDFRDLFAHIRTIYRKDKLRGTLQREFQDYVLSKYVGDKGAKRFVDDMLEPYADVYATVSREPYVTSGGAEKVNTLLQHLNRLDNFDWIPPAMEYFRRHEGQPDKLIKFTRDLERLAYGLFILRAYDTQRIMRYGKILTAIEQGDDLFLENSPLQLETKEKADILKTLGGDIYTQPRIPKPLLLRLDSLLADAGAKYDQPVISIEHVLPQNPASDSDWIKLFPDSDERDEWTHRLANLVLLSRRKNSQASNYEFNAKKSAYFQKKGTAPFALTTQVVNESEWTPKVLECRQRELVGALKKEWRLG